MISVSTSKSGSNWLDRLRSSRGFPTGGEPDLDRFLASSSSCTSCSVARSESTQFTRRVNLGRRSIEKEKDVARDVVSDVLCDLFNMGECSGRLSKKNSRKQSNPRFFNSGDLGKKINDGGSSDDLRREKGDNVVASSGDNSLNDKVRNGSGGGDNGEEEEMINMKEYTRSEVTVIDTSLEEWKSDKWVFRKKDEWKIKDKKSKFTGRKRKLLADDNDEMRRRHKEGGDIDGEMIKKKKILHLNEPQNDRARELLEEAAKCVGKAPQSRFPCPKPPEKLRVESSPVILLKSIPSNNGNGIIRLGKSAKKGRPKKFKII